MSLEEYMGELKGQIRDKNARILVSDEIYAHIEEQADSYQKDGMDREEAMEFIDFNTVRALPYMGEKPPVIMSELV